MGAAGEEAAPVLRALDAAATALVRGPSPDARAAEACINAQAEPAVFNRPYTLLLNRTTHVMDNLITLLRAHPDDKPLNERMLQMIAGTASSVAPELTPMVARLGGFDVLFAALERHPHDADLMMSAWRGLSDHSHNPVGAAIIANHGGPMQGLQFMLDQMRAHPEPGYAEGGDHLTLKYEILQNVNGVLEDDASNAYGRELVRRGLPQQTLFSMRVESGFRATQDVGCRVMSWLLGRNQSVAAELVQLDAIGTINQALVTFREDDPTPWLGTSTTLGQGYPVIPACSGALVGLAKADSANVARMRAAGVPETLASARPEMRPQVSELEGILQQPGGGLP